VRTQIKAVNGERMRTLSPETSASEAWKENSQHYETYLSVLF